MRSLAPPPPLTVSEWADRFRRLSPESSPEPGRWRTARAEYLRGIMDAFTEPGVEEVALEKSAQVGATEAGLNLLGFIIHHDPGPSLVVFPSGQSDGAAARYSKKRLTPMLRDTPEIGALVTTRKRTGSNTISEKVFPGGHVSLVGAGSGTQLRSQPIRNLFFEELDAIAAALQGEGDPIDLARKRTANFWNRRIYYSSTPLLRHASHIDRLFLLGDQRRFFVPCPDCGRFQVLAWARVVWARDPDGTHHPETARYQCESCAALWNDGRRHLAVSRGHWRPTAASQRPGLASFHIWQAYSPWASLESLVREFLDAKRRGLEAMQVFVNTVLGETWEARGDTADETGLAARCIDYPADPVPPEVALLTVGVDVQKNRLEAEILGWGRDERTWSIDYLRIPGDPTTPAPWELLDLRLAQPFRHPSGARLYIAATAIDTGHATDSVYAFTRRRAGRRVLAVKGHGAPAAPLLTPPRRASKAAAAVWMVGTDTAKDLLLARLQQEDPTGHGYCTWPTRYTEAYFRQLTAERRLTTYTRGHGSTKWVLKSHGRPNEALDCRIYAMAAREALAGAGLTTEALNLLVDRTTAGRPISWAPAAKAGPGAPRGRRVISKGYGGENPWQP
jgi:phage terminase large subunit GpA-like protein